MMNYEDFFRHPGWEEILKQFKYEISQAQRPSNEIILDDMELCRVLNCSKRTTATLRSTGQISYHQCGKIQYLLSDVLVYLKNNRVEAREIITKSRFK